MIGMEKKKARLEVGSVLCQTTWDIDRLGRAASGRLNSILIDIGGVFCGNASINMLNRSGIGPVK